MARRESRPSILFPGERQDIEVFVSCRDLKPLDFFKGVCTSVDLYIERNGVYELNSRTEIVKGNSSPDYQKSFQLEFFFAVKQNLKFIVMDCSNEENERPIGEILTSIGMILGSRSQTVAFDVKMEKKKDSVKMGTIIIRAERINYTSDVAKMTMKARQLKISKGIFNKPSYDFALRLYRFLGEPGYGLVYESEVSKNENPRWREINIKFQKLANADYDRNIKAQVVNKTSSKSDTVIGEGCFTVNQLLENQMLDYGIELVNPKTNQKTGTLVVDSFDLIEKPHFLDYLQAGLQFNVIVGIDYTSSNGDPYTPESLHSVVKPNEVNEYMKAILGVCEILLNYDHDKRVMMFGFGGMPQFPGFKSDLTSHCFPLNGDTHNPWAEHLSGIVNVYKNSFKYVQLASPTYFEPIVRQAMEIARRNLENYSNEYTILLMVTDGKCHDMQDTINTIIDSAKLPLSIIIVGVGKNDFTKMTILDGDEGLVNLKGEHAARDLVQFVPFRDFSNNPDLLAKNVLSEIPDQVVSYMQLQGIKPCDLKQQQDEVKQQLQGPRQQQEETKILINSFCTGGFDEESCEENKDQNFNNTLTFIETTSHHFVKALDFMKKENNQSFVNLTKIKNLNTLKSFTYTDPRSSNSTSSAAKISNEIRDNENSY